MFPVTAGLIIAALQAGDSQLLDQVAGRVPPELRELPGSEWWAQLLYDACALPNADRMTSTLAVPTPGLRPFATEALELLAYLWASGGNHAAAARLLGAAHVARSEMGVNWRTAYHQAVVEDAMDISHSAMADEFDVALAEGASTALEDAVLFAQRRRGRRGRPTHGWPSLTPAEVAVAREIATGRTNAQAAERLFIAASTVKSHLETIYTKLGIKGRAALATEVAGHPPA